jgi:hypothetical protein
VPVLYRISAGVFAALFLLGAAVQLNDPDPAVWIVMYCVAAVIAGAAAAGVRRAWYAAAVLVALCVLWGGWLGFGVISEGQHWFDEEGRESMGLLIIAAWNAGVVVWGRKK